LKFQLREAPGPGAQAVGEEDAQAAEEQEGVPVAFGDARAGQIAEAEAGEDDNLQDTKMHAAEVKDNGLLDLRRWRASRAHFAPYRSSLR